jgi:predicted nuclease with TOPRIM domain
MMFADHREDELEKAKETACQELEGDRKLLQEKRAHLEQERERLEKLRADFEAREEQLEQLEDELEDLEDELDDAEDEVQDAESIRELLDVVSEGIPALMRGISDTMYTPEAMEASAKALSAYYRTLLDAGMDKELASELTKVQASQMNRMVVAGRGLRGIGWARPAPPVPPERPAPEPRPTRNDEDGHVEE